MQDVVGSGGVARGNGDAAGLDVGRAGNDTTDTDGDDYGDLDMGEEGTEHVAHTAAELRREWNEAAEAVRLLERRGGPRVSQVVLDRARSHRDDAERARRAAKPPHPLGKRIRWAAAVLETALTKQQTNQRELEEFDADTAR